MLKGLSPKTLLVVLDGYGVSENTTKNAVKDAETPHLDELFSHYPTTTLQAGGEAVGLPAGVAGNSEVGHMNLGAGREIRQDLVRINEAVKDQTLEQMDKLKSLIKEAKNGSKRIHLMGLLSDGGVHSHIDHLKEIAKILTQHEELEIYLHPFMDGRDTAPKIGEKYLKDIEENTTLKIASIQGRVWGMDRDRRWEKIEKAYKAMTGQGEKTKLNARDYLNSEYEKEVYDEFITPALLEEHGAIKNNDSIFFLNFRPDRAVQITLAFNDPNFSEFKRDVTPKQFLCMTPYVPDELDLPILFDKEKVQGGLAQYLSGLGKKQFKIAETEKYAHVTFFFNGGEKKPFEGEQQTLIPSPKEVSTYDEKPEMSAPKVTENLLKALSEDYDFYLVNYANCDMVGHTGNYKATIKAVEAVDQCVGELKQACEKQNMAMIITADHGNSDEMVYKDGGRHTSHTNAPVPFCIFHPKLKDQKLQSHPDSALKDVSPCVLTLMGIDYPQTFNGRCPFIES
jgi:2,3-bisphosphoglycerate-independent phosphoglycerate mutase